MIGGELVVLSIGLFSVHQHLVLVPVWAHWKMAECAGSQTGIHSRKGRCGMVLSSRETHSVGAAMCAAIVFVLAWGTLGAELLIMDKKGRITKTNHGFFQDKPPVPRDANINLKSPVDYSTGKIYAQAEVKLMPTAKDFKLQMQICQYKADGTGPYYGIENCGGYGLMNGTTGETSTGTTWSWSITSMWKAGGVPIDWSRQRTSHAAGGTTPTAHGFDPTSSSLHNGISMGVSGLSRGLYVLRWRASQ